MNIPTRFHNRAVQSADVSNDGATSSTLSEPPVKRGLARFLDGLLGARIDAAPLPHTPLVADSEDGIFVAPPVDGKSWIESFLNAVTEATTRFAQRHVALVHNELPTFGFEVRELRIECKDAPAQFLSAVFSLPQTVLNLSIKSRMSKAVGAEYLFCDKFYGCTVSAEPTLVDGHVVDTLISYAGSRFVLNFSFSGDFIERPEAFEGVTSAQTLAKSTPTSVLEAPKDNTAYKDNLAAVSPPDAFRSTVHERNEPCFGTPLRSMSTISNQSDLGQGTPLREQPSAPPPAVLSLRLRSLGSETVIPLREQNFPYTVGRHSSFTGYSVRGRSDAETKPVLHEVEKPGYTSFASREHLVLDSFDQAAQQLRVSTTKGTNGTFFKMAAMPKHFLLPIASMASGEWLKLGGKTGDGILELRVETV